MKVNIKRKNGKIHRQSLRFKLNIVMVCSILFVAIGLVMLLYRSSGVLIIRSFKGRTERAAEHLHELSSTAELDYIWEIMQTEEFEQVRAEAERQQDDTILKEWMDTIDGPFSSLLTEEEKESFAYETLWFVVDNLRAILDLVKSDFGMKSVYYQKMVGTDTYDLLNDSGEPLWTMGRKEIPLEEFEEYGVQDDIPPTVYHSEYGWLCTACKCLRSLEDQHPTGFACADLDMNELVGEQRYFLLNSILAVILLTVFAVLVNMFILQRLVVHPLKQLAKGTTEFVSGPDGYSEASVIHMNLRRKDEISDLYAEIRSMQKHIITDTDRLKKVTAERERIDTELGLASRIQLMSLPKIEGEFAERAEFTLGASMLPARNVGGDFYDFFFLDPTHLALVIADVSGKGIPASLFMMAAMNQIRGCASPGKTPSEILTAANLLLCRNNPLHMFVTVWMGILDLESGLLTACNAGHENPVLGHRGMPFEFIHDPHGMVLGGMKRAKYKDYTLSLAPGDVLFVYTDGVPEAANSQEAFFGEERLLDTLNKMQERTPAHLLQQLKAGVDAFVEDAQQFDDLTMLCILYNGPAQTDPNKPDVAGSQP